MVLSEGRADKGKGAALYHFRYTHTLTDTGIGYPSDTDSDRWIILFWWITIKYICIDVCFFLHFVFKKVRKVMVKPSLIHKIMLHTATSDYSWKCMQNDPKTPISVQPQSKSKAVVPSGVRAWFWALFGRLPSESQEALKALLAFIYRSLNTLKYLLFLPWWNISKQKQACRSVTGPNSTNIRTHTLATWCVSQPVAGV